MPDQIVLEPHLDVRTTRALWGNWCIRMDGQWFVKCKDAFGLDEAMGLNETAVYRMGHWEVGYGAAFFGLAPPLGPAEVERVIGWLHDHAGITRDGAVIQWHWPQCWNALTAEPAGVAHLGVGNFPGCRGFFRRMTGWCDRLNAGSGGEHWQRRQGCQRPEDGGCYHWVEYTGPRLPERPIPPPDTSETWSVLWRELAWRWFCEWQRAVCEAHGPEAARELEERVARSIGRILAREFHALLPPPSAGEDPALRTLAAIWPGVVTYDPGAPRLTLHAPDPNPWKNWATAVGCAPYPDGALPGAATCSALYTAAVGRLFPDGGPVVRYA